MKSVKPAIAAVLLIAISSCSSVPKQTKLNMDSALPISTDDNYGYTAAQPIMVGGWQEVFAANIYTYLNRLSGPDGQKVSYKRLQACCAFKTKNGMDGVGLLDTFEITHSGLSNPVILYLNGYDKAPLHVPVGLTAR